MSNERDELADVIGTVTDNWDEPLDPVHDIPQIVNAILAAGYRKPREVTTPAELDALLFGSVVLIRSAGTSCAAEKLLGGWSVPGLTESLTPNALLIDGPVTVLHEPTA